MGFHSIGSDELGWEERERKEDEAPRWQAPLTEPLELEGEMTVYMGDPPERVELPAGSVLAVHTGTPLQLRNESDAEARLFIYGAPPEQGGGEFLPDFD